MAPADLPALSQAIILLLLKVKPTDLEFDLDEMIYKLYE